MCTNHINNQDTKHDSDIHNQEHERWNRRSFLQALGLVGGGSLLFANSNITASKTSELTEAINAAETDNVLVIIRLKGGNDGLNTIVPIYDFDRYANLRPTLRYPESSLIKLDDDFGIPPAMKAVESMWRDGAMKVIHGVGYENQDLSHFKSANIWANSDIEDIEDSGFMGRYFEELYPDFLVNPPEIPAAIQIGSIGNLIFDGRGVSNYAVTFANVNQLKDIGENGSQHSLGDIPGCTYGDRLKYLRSVTNTTFTYAKKIEAAFKKSSNSVAYGEKGLGRQLEVVARLIKGGLGTKVYMVSLGGFDTHSEQGEKHAGLLADITNSMKLFYEDLASNELEKKVLSMTISEFGRRAEENGSEGTDHGQAAPIMMFGPTFESSGFIGDHPDLNDLDRIGNLKFNFDFREIYAAAMKDWLCVDAGAVDRAMLDTTFEAKDFGFTCRGIDTGFASNFNFDHNVSIQNGQTFLHFRKEDTSHVNIVLYAITGARVATLRNEITGPGEYTINMSEFVRGVSQGAYVYRILTGGEAFSKQTIVL